MFRFDKSLLVAPATDLPSKLHILAPICKKLEIDPNLTVEKIVRQNLLNF